MMNKAWIAPALMALGFLAGGCHNSGRDANSAEVRALNAVVDAEALDLLIDDNARASAVAVGATSGFTEIDAGTRDVKVRSATNQTIFVDRSIPFADGSNDTVLIYGKRAAIQTAVMTDDTVAVSSGHVRVRVVNLAPDTTAVDAYIGSGDVAGLAPVIPQASYGVVTSSAEITPGTGQVILTLSGTQDVILRSDAQAFNANDHVTIAVVPALGGKLVNAILLVQGGNSTTLTNPVSRIKATNAIADSPGVNFRADGAPLLLNVPFGASSSYVNLSRGSHTLQIEPSSVPGTVAASLDKTLDAARDYSAVAVGTSATPQIVVLADDNSVPALGLAKIRFVNALAGSGAADVQLNFASQASGIAFGTASAYYSVTPSTTYTIVFASPGGLNVLATLAPAELDAGGVYSAYLAGTAGAGQVRLVRDR